MEIYNDRALELIEWVGLTEYANTVAVELPYGRKRALEIATTLALEPEMMLLDEPTAGMGHEDVGRIATLIKRVAQGRTVLMVEHNLRSSPIFPTRSPCWRAAKFWPKAITRRCRRTRTWCRPIWGPAMAEAMLSVSGLNAWYGESHILHGVDFQVREGEVVTLLGRNGAGKTTTMKSVMGIVGSRKGSVKFKGTETIGLPSYAIARQGIAFCPEERGIFASLDVKENLLLPPAVAEGGLSVETIFELFPNLKERLASQGTKLSGGEQQMLAIGRILRTGAKLLLLDEPTEGLAPSSSNRSAARSVALRTRASRSCWSNRISASRPRSRTGTTSWSTAASSTKSPTTRSKRTWRSSTSISASNHK